MKPLDARIEPLLAGLSGDPRLPKGTEESIRRAISESPFLSNLLANAAGDRQIGRIAISYGENNGGHFQDGPNGGPGTIYVSSASFVDRNEAQRLNVLTEILGHETMHGVLTKHRAQALSEYVGSYRGLMDEAYQSRAAVVDLTGPVRTYLDRGRQEEALAEVAGLRALNSRIAHADPTASKDDMAAKLLSLSTSRCVDGGAGDRRLAPGLSYDEISRRTADGDRPLHHAVERCFYDGKGTLGRHGDSDYRNYYGVAPITSVAQDYAYQSRGRQPPEVRIDFRELGLEPRQLERNGLDLGSARVFPVSDFGKDGFGRIELNNTGANARRADPPNRALPSDGPPSIELGAHDRHLLNQIRDKVGELDRAHGRQFDQTSERVSASLLVSAKMAGLSSVDHVLSSNATANVPAGHTLHIVQGDLTNPTSPRAHVLASQTVQRPAQESLEQAAAMGQQQSQAMDTQRAVERQEPPPLHAR